MKFNLKALMYFVLLVSLLGFLETGYHQVKASLAQKLLEDAWRESMLTGENIKPWSWADSWPAFKLQWLEKQHGKGKGNNQIVRSPIKGKTQSSSHSIRAEYLVLADSSGESLAFGPGLHTPNLFPGEMGNSIIAAHRDTHFKELQGMKLNDIIRIELKSGELRQFQVDKIKVVDADIEAPIVGIAERRLTLITCYPFDSNGEETSLRYLVSATMFRQNDKARNQSGFKKSLETGLPGEPILPNQEFFHPSQLAYRF
ncbi:MAG: class GN sortase [Kangiellaceae bacterium]|nr:class GN sortase [Kangiellaceae bacterium]MCW9017659.1 class GN sortase [Kangiellaceae bacterium]